MSTVMDRPLHEVITLILLCILLSMMVILGAKIIWGIARNRKSPKDTAPIQKTRRQPRQPVEISHGDDQWRRGPVSTELNLHENDGREARIKIQLRTPTVPPFEPPRSVAIVWAHIKKQVRQSFAKAIKMPEPPDDE